MARYRASCSGDGRSTNSRLARDTDARRGLALCSPVDLGPDLGSRAPPTRRRRSERVLSWLDRDGPRAGRPRRAEPPQISPTSSTGYTVAACRPPRPFQREHRPGGAASRRPSPRGRWRSGSCRRPRASSGPANRRRHRRRRRSAPSRHACPLLPRTDPRDHARRGARARSARAPAGLGSRGRRRRLERPLPRRRLRGRPARAADVDGTVLPRRRGVPLRSGPRPDAGPDRLRVAPAGLRSRPLPRVPPAARPPAARAPARRHAARRSRARVGPVRGRHARHARAGRRPGARSPARSPAGSTPRRTSASRSSDGGSWSRCCRGSSAASARW
jgi:hypothetical protein